MWYRACCGVVVIFVSFLHCGVIVQAWPMRTCIVYTLNVHDDCVCALYCTFAATLLLGQRAGPTRICTTVIRFLLCVSSLVFCCVWPPGLFFLSLLFVCCHFLSFACAFIVSVCSVCLFVCLLICQFVGLFFFPFLLFLLFLYIRPSLSLPLLFLSAPYLPPPPLRPSAPLRRPSTPIHRQCLQVLEGALTLPSEMQPPPPSVITKLLTQFGGRNDRDFFPCLVSHASRNAWPCFQAQIPCILTHTFI